MKTPVTRAPAIRRRDFLGAGVAAAGAAATVSPAAVAAPAAGSAASSFSQKADYLQAAQQAAVWIRSAEVKVEGGGFWLPDPDHPSQAATVSLPNGFYSGSAGVVLFLIELAAATGDLSYLEDARRGGDYLLRSWRATAATKGEVPGAELGFYTGLTGTAFVLAELWKATKLAAYRDAAQAATDTILKAARPAGSGLEWVSWPGMTGNAGIVLGLLALAETLQDPAIRPAVLGAGNRMVENAIEDPRGGLRWQGMPPKLLGEADGVYWPNFQLGTSGVAYALADLHAATGEARFLKAAAGGALHLQRIAAVRGDAALIPYREPDHTDLYYLGYCNGPAGTARLFHRLYKITKDRSYLDWTEKLARGVMASGIPEHQAPGFWNVVCQCCGSAGVVDFFLGLWAETRRTEYLAFARRVADQMLSRRTDFDGKGYRWYQAYTRIKPWDVTAETGYMIGAAGIGAALLHLHLAEAKQRRAIRLPDDPFPATV